MTTRGKIERLEYLIQLQTEIHSLTKPLENPLLTHLIDMACLEMVDMLTRARIDADSSVSG